MWEDIIGFILLLTIVYLVSRVVFYAYFQARFHFINRIMNMKKEPNNGKG